MVNYRPVRPEDCQIINRWIEADPWHRGKAGMLDFFMKQGCAVLEDNRGAVMVVRFDDDLSTMTVTVHIQFGDASRLRIARTLQEGFRIILRALSDCGMKDIRFESANPVLIAFCKRLGFEHRNGVSYYRLQGQSFPGSQESPSVQSPHHRQPCL